MKKVQNSKNKTLALYWSCFWVFSSPVLKAWC